MTNCIGFTWHGLVVGELQGSRDQESAPVLDTTSFSWIQNGPATVQI